MDFTNPAPVGAFKKDATVAPTSNATSSAAELANKTGKLTEKELDFVTLVHMHWNMYATLMTADKAQEDYGLEPKQFNKLLNSSAVITALEERGVEVKRLTVDPTASNAWRSSALSPRQLITANVMLDLLDTRSERKKLQDLKVDSKTWQTWLRDPVFSDYLRVSTEKLLGNSQHEASLALLDKVRAGDTKAIEFYMELTGRYTRASAKTTASTNSIVDIQNLLVRVVEIIADEVDDPAIAARIADRFKSLMTARTIAGELVEPGSTELTRPEVAPARELTPELRELMGGNLE